MNTKDLHKLVARLKEARFLCQFNRPEVKDGNLKPTSRIYYYIDYRQAIDGIKWRVYTITKEIQGNSAPVSEKKEYFCPACKAEWTTMEVLDHSSDEGFLCHDCNHPLVHDLDRNTTGHEKATKLNNQFQFMTTLLQQIDQVAIPANNFDVALSRARPVIRDSANPGVKSVPVDMSANRPTAVKGLTNVGPKSMAINISAADGPTEAEKAAEKDRKDRVAQQNALPSWMSNSTVTGESFSGAHGPSLFPKQEAVDAKDPALQAALTDKDHQAILDVYATLRAEQAQKDLEDDEEYGSDDEDEDDGDFEDVLASANNSTGATPATNAVPTDVDVRPAKRVKVESPPSAAVGNDDEDESDEDLEFVDVG
jgi:transcription initiation factor TFIIE subunit alpha